MLAFFTKNARKALGKTIAFFRKTRGQAKAKAQPRRTKAEANRNHIEILSRKPMGFVVTFVQFLCVSSHLKKFKFFCPPAVYVRLRDRSYAPMLGRDIVFSSLSADGAKPSTAICQIAVECFAPSAENNEKQSRAQASAHGTVRAISRKLREGKKT